MKYYRLKVTRLAEKHTHWEVRAKNPEHALQLLRKRLKNPNLKIKVIGLAGEGPEATLAIMVLVCFVTFLWCLFTGRISVMPP